MGANGMLKHGVPQSLLGGKSFNFVAGQYLLYPRSGFKELLQAIIYLASPLLLCRFSLKPTQ
jgi:hypothetical protein